MSFKESTNTRMRWMYEVAMSDARSLMRGNRDIILESWNGADHPPPLEPDTSVEFEALRELMNAREGIDNLVDLSKDEIDEIVMLLCLR